MAAVWIPPWNHRGWPHLNAGARFHRAPLPIWLRKPSQGHARAQPFPSSMEMFPRSASWAVVTLIRTDGTDWLLAEFTYIYMYKYSMYFMCILYTWLQFQTIKLHIIDIYIYWYIHTYVHTYIYIYICVYKCLIVAIYIINIYIYISCAFMC